MQNIPSISQDFRDKLRLHQSQTVLLYFKDGRTLFTYLRTALVYIGQLEILKKEMVTKLINNPSARGKILSDPKNYELISLDQVLKIEASDLKSFFVKQLPHTSQHTGLFYRFMPSSLNQILDKVLHLFLLKR